MLFREKLLLRPLTFVVGCILAWGIFLSQESSAQVVGPGLIVQPPCCTGQPEIISTISERPAGEDDGAFLRWLDQFVRSRSDDALTLDGGAVFGFCREDCAPRYRAAAFAIDRETTRRVNARILPGMLEGPNTTAPKAASSRVPSATGPERPQPATNPSPFANRALRTLMDWQRPLDEIPNWLGTQLRGAGVNDLRVLAAALAGRCETPEGCSPPLVVGRVHIDSMLADHFRAEDQRRRENETGESFRTAMIALLVSTGVALLCGIMSVIATFSVARAKDTRVAADALASAAGALKALAIERKARSQTGRRKS